MIGKFSLLLIFLFFNRYKIHYLYENSVIIISLSEQVKDENAFSFLYEIKKDILKEYSNEELLNTNSYQLNKGKQNLKKKMQYYNSNQITTSSGEIIEDLNLAKNAVFENIETLLDRNNKIEMIINKSNSLKDSANIVSNIVENIQYKESGWKRRSIIFVGTFIIIIIIILCIIIFD